MGTTIYVTSDHAGFALKTEVVQYLKNKNVIDLGPFNQESVDYPDFSHLMALKLSENSEAIGIAICGSGNGIAIGLNRHQHIRAGLVWQPAIAELIKAHNNANVIVFPARFMNIKEVVQSLKLYFETPFEGGRHQLRIDKLNF